MATYYDLTRINDTEIELSIAHWSMRGVQLRLRICLQNQGQQFAVAMPGRGGDFRLAYRWVFTRPVDNTGFAKIRRAMLESQGLAGSYTESEKMTEQVAKGINAARKKLRDDWRKETYEFSVYAFDDREIEQIIKMFKLWMAGTLRPVRPSRYTHKVVQWAKNWGLIVSGETMLSDSLYYFRRDEDTDPDRLYYSHGSAFDVARSLPPEALWRLVRPIIENAPGYEGGTVGYSVTKEQGWLKLNIFPVGHHSFEDIYLDEIWQILHELDMSGYIRFLSAGSIWEIRVLEQEEE